MDPVGLPCVVSGDKMSWRMRCGWGCIGEEEKIQPRPSGFWKEESAIASPFYGDKEVLRGPCLGVRTLILLGRQL